MVTSESGSPCGLVFSCSATDGRIIFALGSYTDVPFLLWMRLAGSSAARAIGTCSLAFPTTLSFSAAHTAFSVTMEPAVENLLFGRKVHKDVNMALRVAEITDCGLFVALDSTVEGLAASAKEAFGVGLDVRELGKLTQAGNLAKVQSDTKYKIDGRSRAWRADHDA